LEVKRMIRNSDLSKLTPLAKRLLQTTDAGKLARLLETFAEA